MTLLGWSAITFGAALLAIAALGVLRLPGALARQHAATKAATLGLGVMIAGLAILQPSAAWWLRLGLLLAALVLTVPVASHALARAAAKTDCEGWLRVNGRRGKRPSSSAVASTREYSGPRRHEGHD